MNSNRFPKPPGCFTNVGPRLFVALNSALFLAAAILASGCASVSVQKTAGLNPEKNEVKPRRIIVADFAIPKSASIRVDRKQGELSEFEQKLTANLRESLVENLQPFGIPVKTTGRSGVERLKKTRQAAWLITGEFTRVNQGSRALRLILGLGAGGTKMETKVRIFDLSEHGLRKKQPLIELKTTGGSNAEPGAIVNAGPEPISAGVGAAITLITSGMHGVTEDTRRTARMIADYVSEELAAHGVIPEARVKKAKHLGQFP